MIRRRFSKRDGNHTQIVRTLRLAGYLVIELHGVGGNCPDVLVVGRGRVVLMEIKAEKGTLTPGQELFHGAWRGPPGSLVVVRTERQALAAMG